MCVKQRFFFSEAVTGRVMKLFPKYLVLINMISSKMLLTKQATLVRSWIYSLHIRKGCLCMSQQQKKCTSNAVCEIWEGTNSCFSITDSQVFKYDYNHHKWDLITLFLPSLLNKVLLWWTNTSGISDNAWPCNVRCNECKYTEYFI